MIKNYNIRKAYFDNEDKDFSSSRYYDIIYNEIDDKYILYLFLCGKFRDVLVYSFVDNNIKIRDRLSGDDYLRININIDDIIVVIELSNKSDSERYLNRLLIYKVYNDIFNFIYSKNGITIFPICAFKFTNVNELLTINKRTKNKKIIDIINATYSMLLLGNTTIKPVLLD